MSNYGKFFIHRNLFESDIWEKVPYFSKIWIWIIGRANYNEVKKGGQIFERGQFLTTIPEIIEANKWFIGWGLKRLTKDQVWRVLEFLRKTGRITTSKTIRGLFIKVQNYDYYQAKSDNQSNSQSNKEATVNQHYKSNNDNKEKKVNAVSFLSTDSPSSSKVQPPSEASHNQKGKEKDPRVKEVIKFFCDACEEIRGFKPRVSHKIEVNMIKKYLKDFTVEDLTDEIDWFLKEDECNKLGCTIKIALSAYVFNKWQDNRED